MTSPFLTEVVNQIATELQFVAPTTFTIKDRNWNVDPPNYMVFPKTIQLLPPYGPGMSANPRALHKMIIEAEYHCWGRDVPESERLFQGLITAIRDTMSGASYTVGNARYLDTENLAYGYVIVVPIQFIMALPRADIPTSPGSITDDTFPKVTILHVGFDESGDIVGDDILQGPGEH